MCWFKSNSQKSIASFLVPHYKNNSTDLCLCYCFYTEIQELMRGKQLKVRRSEVSTDDLKAPVSACQPCAARKRKFLLSTPKIAGEHNCSPAIFIS